MAEKRKHRKMPLVVLLFVAAVLVLWFLIYITPAVEDVLTKTEIVSYGTIQIADECTCYFVRNEQVFTAGQDGSPQYYFEEGEKVRKDTRIMDMVPAGGDYITTESGKLVSYRIDGNESIFTPENMENITCEQVQALTIEMQDVRKESVLSGDPVYKLADGNVWYALAWVDGGSVANYTVGAPITLRLPEGEVPGTVKNLQSEGERWKVTMEFDRSYPGQCGLRKEEAVILTADNTGLMVRNISITTQDGTVGVFVKQLEGTYEFVPVRVVMSDGTYSIVESTSFDVKSEDGSITKVATVEPYDEILTNAQQ